MAFFLLVLAPPVGAGDTVVFKGGDYEFVALARLAVFPPDLAQDRVASPGAPAPGFEFAAVRLKASLIPSADTPQPDDAVLMADTGPLKCKLVNITCRGEGCRLTLVFYAPIRAELRQLELGGTPIRLHSE
ncbi:MAG: hypothetical protein AB7O37_01085 [Vicinamibacteria bacterium]